MHLLLLASLCRPAAGLDPLDAQAILLIEAQRLPPVALGSYLEHPDAATRARAARGLGRLRDGGAVAGLRRLAADPDVQVRREVAFALGQTPGATPVLVTRLAEETDPETRALLIDALGKTGDGQVVPMLLDALGTQATGLASPPEVAAAARALGRLAMREVPEARKPLVVERLLRQLHRSDRVIRQDAAYALSRLEPGTLQPPTRDVLLHAATRDWDPVVRAFLVRAAGRLDLTPAEADLLLGSAAKDTATGVRIAAARAAATLRWQGVTRLLDDEDRGVRREAITAVASLDAVEPASLLLPFVERGATLAAAEAMATRGDPAMIEAATAMRALAARGRLPDVDRYLAPSMPTVVRAAAVRGVNTPARLIELASHDAEAPVRTEAAGRLTELSPDPALLLPLLQASDPVVASIAADHLARHPAPKMEPLLADALIGSDAPDLMRAAADAISARYAGHPNPPIRKHPGLIDALPRLDGHPDGAVRASARKLRAALGLPAARAMHPPMTAPLDEVARIHGARVLTSRGEVRIDLLPDQAPLTVWNFAWLADRDFYDNLVLHRVVPDFVVQDGDPRGDGYGGPGWTLPDEINPVRYDEGVVGMALSGPDTGGSQWFVTLAPQPHLDGGYTAFGRVTHGLGLLRTLQPGDRILDVIIERSPPPEG